MKPAAFRYAAPRTVEETVDLLERHGDEAKVLAGGQSLGPLLNLRLATPSVVVDVNGVGDLAPAPADGGGSITIGAMTRQRDAERSPVVAAGCPLMRDALPFVAHRTIRNRGTVGGSLTHADPAAELPAVAVAVDAELIAVSRGGTRVVAAADFFLGFFTTALAPEELLTAVRLPKPAPRTGSAWQEFAPRHGDFAIVGVAATVRLAGDGTVASARLVYSGVADVPRRRAEAEAVLVGQPATEQAFAAAAATAAAAAGDPPSDLLASADYRRHLVEVLTVRALHRAADRAEES